MIWDSHLIPQASEDAQHTANAQLMFTEFITGGLFSLLGLKGKRRYRKLETCGVCREGHPVEQAHRGLISTG